MTNETDVYENLVYNAGDDGMETDGRCSNVRIWSNTFHDVLMGISLAPVYDGPVYAVRNLIYRTGVGNNGYTGSPFKYNSGYGLSGPKYLFHNTSDAALTAPRSNGLYVKAPGSWELIYARNNIWAGTDYAIYNYNTGQPIDLDYDDLWNDGTNDLVRWDGTRYPTLGGFSAATGQEAHGFDVEPGFVDAGMGDYTLDAASDLIDAGVIIPGINDGYEGAAPDVGAYEFAPSLTLHGAPGNQAIYLDWEVNTTIPLTSTWRISYCSETVSSPVTHTGIVSSTRACTLPGLTNYAWYTVTLSAMLDTTPILTDTVRVMPTNLFVHLPLVMEH